MFSSSKIPESAGIIIREWYQAFNELFEKNLEREALSLARVNLLKDAIAKLTIAFENNEENSFAYLRNDSVKVVHEKDDIKLILADQLKRSKLLPESVKKVEIVEKVYPPLAGIPYAVSKKEGSNFEERGVVPEPHMVGLTNCIRDLINIMRRRGRDNDEQIREALGARIKAEWKGNSAAIIQALKQPGVSRGAALVEIAQWAYSGDDSAALSLLLPGLINVDSIKSLDNLFKFLKDSILLQQRKVFEDGLPLYEAESMDSIIKRTINHKGIIDNSGFEPVNVYDIQQLLIKQASQNVELMDIISESSRLEKKYGKPQAQISSATVQMLVDFAASGNGFTADLQMDANVRDTNDEAYYKLIGALDELKKNHEREWYNLMSLDVSYYGGSKLNDGLEALKRGECLNSYKRGMAQCLFESFALSNGQKEALYNSYAKGTKKEKTSDNWSKGGKINVKITEREALNKEEEDWQHYFNICANDLSKLNKNINGILDSIGSNLGDLERDGAKKQKKGLFGGISYIDRDMPQIQTMRKIENQLRENRYDLIIKIGLLENSLKRMEQINKAMGGGGEKELRAAKESFNQAMYTMQKLEKLMGFLESIEQVKEDKVKLKNINAICDKWIAVVHSVRQEFAEYDKASSQISSTVGLISPEIQMTICMEVLKFISMQNAKAKHEKLDSAALYHQYNGGGSSSKVIPSSSKEKYKGPKQSDDTWLDNAEISRLFEVLGHAPTNVAFMEGLTLSPSIVGAPIETQATFICDSLKEQIDQMRLNGHNNAKLYMPLNLGQNHWVLLECALDHHDPKKATFTFIDSRGVEHDDFQVAQSWIKAIGKTLFPKIQKQDFQFVHTGQQVDGYSCAYITVQNALDRANDRPLSIPGDAPAQQLKDMRISFLSHIYGAENVIGSKEEIASHKSSSSSKAISLSGSSSDIVISGSSKTTSLISSIDTMMLTKRLESMENKFKDKEYIVTEEDVREVQKMSRDLKELTPDGKIEKLQDRVAILLEECPKRGFDLQKLNISM